MGAPLSRHAPGTPPPTGSFAKSYTFTGLTLATSGTHEVREALHVTTGAAYAVKCVARSAPAEADVQNEITVLKRLGSHPRVVHLVDAFEDTEFWYLVMERIRGGDLFDRLTAKIRYDESEARLLVEQLLLAVDACHAQGIVHHDLRPETILLVATDDDVSIKLTDFGCAALVTSPNERSLTCRRGTPGYLAPEVVNGERHGCAVDVWSLGVVTYIALCGSPPIYGNDDTEIICKTKLGKFAFESSEWDDISCEAKDFVCKAMMRNQVERYTMGR